MILAVGNDHLIQDLATHEAVPGMELHLPGVISDILKSLQNHEPITSSTGHVHSSFLVMRLKIGAHITHFNVL